MEGTFSNESIEEKNPTNKGGKVYIIILRSVLSKFVMLVGKTEWFLSDQYFPVFRQNDRKRSILCREVFLILW